MGQVNIQIPDLYENNPAIMSTENPVIKFSPFEALLIGEKNRVAKRKPMKNTIFVTRLTQQKKALNLRELFDVKGDETTTDEDSLFKKPKRVNGYSKNKKNLRVNQNNSKKVKCKSKSNSDMYCYEFEGRKIIVNSNKMVKIGTKNKKVQSNKVRFKPEFKFKETLEERIVNKMQKRKKNSTTNVIENAMLSQMKKNLNQRHCLRGKDGKFIPKKDYNKMGSTDTNGKTKCISEYLKRLYTKKSVSILNTSKNHFGLRFKQARREEDATDLPNKRIRLDQSGCDNILDDISNQYYQNIFSKEVEFPPLPGNLEVINFEDDTYLLDILCECKPRGFKLSNEEEFDESSENAEIIQRRKGLKMYERKKSTAKNGIREFFNHSLKENHCINKGLNVYKLENLNGNKRYVKGRRNGMNYLIDERPTKDNHLISDNKFRSLFYKTACGSETYLGNIIKPVLLNSSFGRLPDIS